MSAREADSKKRMSTEGDTRLADYLPPLLRLPGELRNKIFKIALTAASPLCHRPPVTIYDPVSPSTSAHHRLVEERLINTQGSDAKCLRPDFNSLKFVSKQLYMETAGLEVQTSAILFSSGRSSPYFADPQLPAKYGKQRKTAEQLFFEFSAPMTPRKLGWLASVIIASSVACPSRRHVHAPPMPDLPALAMFCRHHPATQVRYEFTNFHFDVTEKSALKHFLATGVVLTTALQGNEVGMTASPSWGARLYEEARYWRDTWNIMHLFKDIENFTVWPNTRTQSVNPVDLEIFMRNAGLLGLNDGEYGVWLFYIKMWLEHGISGLE